MKKIEIFFKVAPLSMRRLHFAGLPIYMMGSDGNKVKGIATSYHMLHWMIIFDLTDRYFSYSRWPWGGNGLPIGNSDRQNPLQHPMDKGRQRDLSPWIDITL